MKQTSILSRARTADEQRVINQAIERGMTIGEVIRCERGLPLDEGMKTWAVSQPPVGKLAS